MFIKKLTKSVICLKSYKLVFTFCDYNCVMLMILLFTSCHFFL